MNVTSGARSTRGARLTCLCGLALLIAFGCGGRASSQARRHVRVRIDVLTTSFRNPDQQRKSIFVLTCDPTGGTLPFASRVCADIARHPTAMLHPGAPRSFCSPNVTDQVAIATTVDGRTSTEPLDVPGCNWPGSARLGVYLAAALRQRGQLLLWERRLRCDEPPFVGPSPPSLLVCELDEIRTAERVPALAALRPAALFPANTGSRACDIPAGGPVSRFLHGTCSVSVAPGNLNHRKLVFTEAWTNGPHRQEHTWLVSLNRSPPVLLAQSGVGPPQLWW